MAVPNQDDTGLHYGRVKKEAGVYQEMWFFDISDIQKQIHFFLNFNVNVYKKFGFALKCADVVVHAETPENFFHNEGNQGFYFKYKCHKDSLNFIFGDRDFEIKGSGQPDGPVSVFGKESVFGFGFDFKIIPLYDSWPITRINVGINPRDFFTYYPAIPLGSVKGVVSFDGHETEIDCHGYHDHHWGYINSIRWKPWIITKQANIAASVFQTPHDSMVCVQTGDLKISSKIESIKASNFTTLNYPRFKNIYTLPETYEITGIENDHRVKMKVRFKTPRLVNMGFGKRECLAVHDTTAVSDIEIFRGDESIYKFENIPSTIYDWDTYVA